MILMAHPEPYGDPVVDALIPEIRKVIVENFMDGSDKGVMTVQNVVLADEMAEIVAVWASDRFEELKESHKARLDTEREQLDFMRRKVVTFDQILDKIIKAANGMPLCDIRSGYDTLSRSMGSYIGSQSPTDAQREEFKLSQMHERIVDLESRLASVVAVTQFAKSHKA